MIHNRKLTIVQHNVQCWRSNKNALVNIYQGIDPDIILLNGTSVLQNENLKIFNYNVFTKNSTNQRLLGVAIAIRKTITARTDDGFYQDFLITTIQSQQGPISIATGYVPPSQDYINSIDLHEIFNRDHPVYFFGDLNANHRSLGYSSTNRRGTQIATLINHNRIKHLGPHFPTRLAHSTARSPDIALTNNEVFANSHLRQGPLTPSDHHPIIAIITTDPIQIPIKPRFQFSKTDWTAYKSLLSEKSIQTQENETLEAIDDHISTFDIIVKEATIQTTPILRYRRIPGVKPNSHINHLQCTHKRIINLINSIGINPNIHNLVLSLRAQIRDEYNRLSKEAWESLINQLELTRDPKAFFNSIKRMMGTNSQAVPYIKHNGTKFFTSQDQEPIYRNHWKTIFSADDPIDNNFNHRSRRSNRTTTFRKAGQDGATPLWGLGETGPSPMPSNNHGGT